MDILLGLSRAIDGMNRAIGRAAMWLLLLAVVISTGNAIIRKAFDVSSNVWLEAQWQLFGCVFMLCAAWTLLDNEHIRIDILNARLPTRVRNWIELIGHVFFLMPFVLILLYDGWPFFVRSWRGDEQSFNSGGLPQYTAKFLIPLGFFLLFLQGISEIVKRIAIMQGRIADPHAGTGAHTAEIMTAERI
jgi:TRAP-type mannitol/chloroaromatic compound transport system permease small subunit